MPIPKKQNYKTSKPSPRGPSSIATYKTICDSCHKPCEVPFKPNGKKPVFCDSCFSNTKEMSQKPYTNPSKGKTKTIFDIPEDVVLPEYRKNVGAASTDTRIADIKRELSSANAKLDKLIDLFSKFKQK